MLHMENLHYPKIGADSHVIKLNDDLLLEQWIVPKGAEIKTRQSMNFGYVFIPKGTRDKRGFTIPKRIFRY